MNCNKCCMPMLLPDTNNSKFCMLCRSSVVTSTLNQSPPSAEILAYCASSGSAITAKENFFKCMECDKLYLQQYSFEDKPICLPCAYASGLSQTLEKSGLKIEA